MAAKRSPLKKAIRITIAVLLLLSVSFGGYIYFRIATSYRTRIPANATAVVKVDVYGIYSSLLRELVFKKRQTGTGRVKGLEVPANIFLYSLKGKQPTTFFGTLQLDDAAAFGRYLEQRKTLSPQQPLAGNYKVYTNGTFTVAFNNTRVAFACAIDKEPVTDVLLDLLQDKNMVAVNQSRFSDIKAQDGHIAFFDGQHKGSLDFNKGALHAVITLAGRGFEAPATVMHQQIDDSAAAYLRLYANPAATLTGKTITAGNHTLSGDSLIAAGLQGIELTIGKPVIQQDTVVTYEYNDDFEKVATVSVKAHQVPGIRLDVKARVQPLYSYLQRQQLINADSNTVNKALFPLYQLYVAGSPAYLSAATAASPQAVAHNSSSNDFFRLYISFPKLMQLQDLAPLSPYCTAYSSLEATARQRDKGHTVIEATLHFRNSKRSSLLQLLELL